LYVQNFIQQLRCKEYEAQKNLQSQRTMHHTSNKCNEYKIEQREGFYKNDEEVI